MKCPTCGSQQFYAKDPEDEFEELRFSLQGEAVVPDPDNVAILEMTPQTETYCERCAWHGRLTDLKS